MACFDCSGPFRLLFVFTWFGLFLWLAAFGYIGGLWLVVYGLTYCVDCVFIGYYGSLIVLGNSWYTGFVVLAFIVLLGLLPALLVAICWWFWVV